jgi:cytochrome oxidase Cu insertion factor (SCO1/SenC/PrrC family)
MRAALFPILALLTSPGLPQAHEVAHQDEQRLPTLGAAPDFALTSQDGAEVTLGALRGKVVAVTFIYVPPAQRQDGASAGRAGTGFRYQSRLPVDHR